MRNTWYQQFTLTVAIATLLAACGGSTGGGDSSSSSGDVWPPANWADIPVSQPNAMATAMSSGDATQVTLADVSSYLQNQAVSAAKQHAAISAAIFSAAGGRPSAASWTANNTIAYQLEPIHLLRYTRVLVDNVAVDSKKNKQNLLIGLASAQNDWRHAVLAGNPFFNKETNAEMDAYLKGLLIWLAGGKAPRNIVFANLPDKTYYRWVVPNSSGNQNSSIKTWLSAAFGSTLKINGAAVSTVSNAQILSCYSASLAGCVNSATNPPDLVIVSNGMSGDYVNLGGNSADAVDGVVAALKTAQENKIPVLYLKMARENNALALALLTFFGITPPWAGLSGAGIAASDLSNTSPGAEIQIYQATAERVNKGSFTAWQGPGANNALVTGCVDVLAGKMDCSEVPGLKEELFGPITTIQKRLKSLEAAGIDIFATPGYELERAMVLLGDKLRADLTYPMAVPNGDASVTQGFSKSLMADYLTYNQRGYAQPPRSLGLSRPTPLPA